MKTIHKLVLKAYLGPMVLTFFIVMFVLMMNIVWRYIDELVGKGLSAGIIIELMTYLMATMTPPGLPLAMLLAAIMTMGNLGENYELLAMKSAGMSLVRITKPLIILVSVIAVGSFFIGNNLVPYANKKVYSIIYDIRQQKQSLEFQDGLFFNGIDNMSIRVSRQEPETHLLRDVLIYDNRIADGNMNTIVADSATASGSPRAGCATTSSTSRIRRSPWKASPCSAATPTNFRTARPRTSTSCSRISTRWKSW